MQTGPRYETVRIELTIESWLEIQKLYFPLYRYNQFASQFTGAMAKSLYALRDISICKCLSNLVVCDSLAQRAFAGCACLLPKCFNSSCTKNAASAESIASPTDDLKSASVTLLIFFFNAFLWLQSQHIARHPTLTVYTFCTVCADQRESDLFQCSLEPHAVAILVCFFASFPGSVRSSASFAVPRD